jgi:hypothetical protein
MNSWILTLSAKQLRNAATIREKIDDLQRELHRIMKQPFQEAGQNHGGRSSGHVSAVSSSSRKKRTMSAAARAKIAAAARERWKKAKAAGKTTL